MRMEQMNAVTLLGRSRYVNERERRRDWQRDKEMTEGDSERKKTGRNK